MKQFNLKNIQKKAKKQSNKGNYWGWFQNQNAGNVPLNNAIFNSMMDTSGISGEGEADGGIGITGTMGEDLKTKEDSLMPDQVKFYYVSNQENPEAKWYQQEVDEIIVGKEDVIKALCHLLTTYPEFVDMEPEELHQYVEANWYDLKDALSDELYDIFNHKIDDGSSEGENFTDSFYDDEVQEVCADSDDCEEDPYFLMSTFEGVPEEDPEISITEYEPIHSYSLLSEAYDKPDRQLNFDKLLDRAFNYGYAYGYEGDEAFDNFMKKIKVPLSREEKERLRAAFDNGNHEGDLDEQERDYMGFNEDCQTPALELGHCRQPKSPYEDLGEDLDADDDPEEEELKNTVGAHSPRDAKMWLDDNLSKYGNTYNFPSKEKQELNRLISDFGNTYFWDRFDEDLNHIEYDDAPLQESEMSDLDLDAQDPEYVDRLERSIRALEAELDFLHNQAPQEIKRGGAFDSVEEIDDAVEATDRELRRNKAKLAIIKKAGRD